MENRFKKMCMSYFFMQKSTELINWRQTFCMNSLTLQMVSTGKMFFLVSLLVGVNFANTKYFKK